MTIGVFSAIGVFVVVQTLSGIFQAGVDSTPPPARCRRRSTARWSRARSSRRRRRNNADLSNGVMPAPSRASSSYFVRKAKT